MATSRRDFLKLTGAGAVLAVGFRLDGQAPDAAVLRPDAWLRVAGDGRATVTVGKSEMGQGVRTALPMIAAEELGLPWHQVDLVQAEPGPDFKDLGTGGSNSVEGMWQPLRRSAAAAREMLIAAAAAQWGVAPASCHARQGAVLHGDTGRTLAYGPLVAAAARLPVPKDPPLKPVSAYELLGKPMARYDGPRIVDGSARYGLDIKLPGMKYAVVARCPVMGGKARSWNAAKVTGRPGVRGVVALRTGVAVLADSTYQAMTAAAALEVVWDGGPLAGFSSDAFRAHLERLAARPGLRAREEGDAPLALAVAPNRVTAQYVFPWQAHATLEPPNCVAHVRGDGCEIWTGCQLPNEVQSLVAKLLGMPAEQVRVHVPLMGGGFGRRLNSDYAVEAAELSRAVKGPVQVVWTRQDDIQNDFYHPMSVHRLEAGLDHGAVTGWLHRVAAPSILLSWEGHRTPAIVSEETIGATDIPYPIANLAVEFAEAACHVPLGWWRGVESVSNVFARECFLDEVAAAAGRDPLAFRLDLLGDPGIRQVANKRVDIGRLKRVLQLAADQADWGKPPASGRGRGIACCAYDGRTYVAHVAEVSEEGGKLRVHRVVAAVDCGLVLNPSGAEGQVESGITWGLSALRSAITFKDGRVQQKSFNDLAVWEMGDATRIDIHLVPSREPPTGIGEPPVPPLIPAVLNALYAATGRRVRALPMA
jgi:isoquinoline 1-oxidoreductase subunit beta